MCVLSLKIMTKNCTLSPTKDWTPCVRFDGPMANALAHINLAIYRNKIQFIWKGKKILYAKAKRAIYGIVRAAYLFWLKLSGSLKKWGFIQNP